MVKCFEGFEISKEMSLASVQNASRWIHRADVVSPHGGIGAAECNQNAASNDHRVQMAKLYASDVFNPMSYVLYVDIYIPALTTTEDLTLCSMRLAKNDGTYFYASCVVKKTGTDQAKLEWYSNSTASGGKGTVVASSLGSVTLSITTWYRLGFFVERPTQAVTGDAKLRAVINGTLDATATINATWGGTGGANEPYIGCYTGATAVDGSVLYDNAVLLDNLYNHGDKSNYLQWREFAVVTMRPASDGTDQDFSASTGTDHAALVDETPQNGTGTTDSDYVTKAASVGASYYESYLMTTPTMPAEYKVLRCFRHNWWHREVGASDKWPGMFATMYYEGTRYETSLGVLGFPGASYTFGYTFDRNVTGSAGGQGDQAHEPVLDKFLESNFEAGMILAATSEAIEWRVSAFSLDLCLEKTWQENVYQRRAVQAMESYT